MDVKQRIEIERRVVTHLVNTMRAHGWQASLVNDGGDEMIKTKTTEEVLDAVFAVDMASIIFTKGAMRHHALIVLGNDGRDCINDYSYGEDDIDDFDKVMKEHVNPFTEALQ